MTSQLKLFGDYVYLPNTNSFTGSKTVTLLHHLTDCYTLSHPETRWVLSDCTMGYRTLASSTIPSIPFHPSSWLFCLLIHSWIPFLFAFHVSKLCFVSCFHFTSHLRPPCSISVPWTPTLIYAQFLLPWHDSLQYLYIPNLMYVPQSEIDIYYPSNSSSKPPNPFPKFEHSRHLVVQHISWSQVLAEHLAPRYALGPHRIS